MRRGAEDEGSRELPQMAVEEQLPILIRECPVCGRDFAQREPKFLPNCAHVVCRDCLLSTSGPKNPTLAATCPVCQTEISNLRPDCDPCDPVPDLDLEAEREVARLPTDLAAVAFAEAYQVLGGDSSPFFSSCGACGKEHSLKFYCTRCRQKLCQDCGGKSHPEASASPLEAPHPVRELRELSPKRLAASGHVTCQLHGGVLAEGYCRNHGRPVCLNCAQRDHGRCRELKYLREVARVERDNMVEQSGRLKEVGLNMDKKIRQLEQDMKEIERHFQNMQNEVKAHFETLERALRTRQMSLTCSLQNQKDSLLQACLAQQRALKDLAPRLARHSAALQRIAATCPDGDLMEMLKQLGPTWRDLENTRDLAASKPFSEDEDLPSLDDAALSELNTCIAGIDFDQTKKQQAKLQPRVSSVGNFVRRGRDWSFLHEDEDGKKEGMNLGVVLKVGEGPEVRGQGWVLVFWEATGKCRWYRMDAENLQEVELF